MNNKVKASVAALSAATDKLHRAEEAVAAAKNERDDLAEQLAGAGAGARDVDALIDGREDTVSRRTRELKQVIEVQDLRIDGLEAFLVGDGSAAVERAEDDLRREVEAAGRVAREKWLPGFVRALEGLRESIIEGGAIGAAHGISVREIEGLVSGWHAVIGELPDTEYPKLRLTVDGSNHVWHSDEKHNAAYAAAEPIRARRREAAQLLRKVKESAERRHYETRRAKAATRA